MNPFRGIVLVEEGDIVHKAGAIRKYTGREGEGWVYSLHGKLHELLVVPEHVEGEEEEADEEREKDEVVDDGIKRNWIKTSKWFGLKTEYVRLLKVREGQLFACHDHEFGQDEGAPLYIYNLLGKSLESLSSGFKLPKWLIWAVVGVAVVGLIYYFMTSGSGSEAVV